MGEEPNKSGQCRQVRSLHVDRRRRVVRPFEPCAALRLTTVAAEFERAVVCSTSSKWRGLRDRGRYIWGITWMAPRSTLAPPNESVCSLPHLKGLKLFRAGPSSRFLNLLPVSEMIRRGHVVALTTGKDLEASSTYTTTFTGIIGLISQATTCESQSCAYGTCRSNRLHL